jgi:uncharacterized protein YlxW (UPF0749 family)
MRRQPNIAFLRSLVGVAIGLLLAREAIAQAPIEVPNPMAAHTLFVILITAAFLAWAASFSIQIMRERTHQKKRHSLRQHRETLLDKITELETALESGTISKERYRRRMRELRGELSRVIGEIQASPGKKHA